MRSNKNSISNLSTTQTSQRNSGSPSSTRSLQTKRLNFQSKTFSSWLKTESISQGLPLNSKYSTALYMATCKPSKTWISHPSTFRMKSGCKQRRFARRLCSGRFRFGTKCSVKQEYSKGMRGTYQGISFRKFILRRYSLNIKSLLLAKWSQELKNGKRKRRFLYLALT